MPPLYQRCCKSSFIAISAPLSWFSPGHLKPACPKSQVSRVQRSLAWSNERGKWARSLVFHMGATRDKQRCTRLSRSAFVGCFCSPHASR